ncbi:MAG: Crp/Fnr family transcriptional regulator, partial [Acidimicrobiales bacterium]
DVPAGRTIIFEDRNHNDIYVVQSGIASVTIAGDEVAEIPAGEMFGEMGFFVHGNASATVVAKTDMSLLTIPYNRFGQILDENPALVRGIANELAQRLHETDARLHD